MTTHPRQRLGAAGEEMAVRTLEEHGLRVIARNWRCSVGELDIVAEEDAPDFSRGGAPAVWRVLFEVLTRRGDRYGSALQSITPRKQAKLREVAAEEGPPPQHTIPVDDQGTTETSTTGSPTSSS